MPLAPIAHGIYNRDQTVSFVGKAVFHFWRHLWVFLTHDQIVRFHFFQRFAQHNRSKNRSCGDFASGSGSFFARNAICSYQACRAAGPEKPVTNGSRLRLHMRPEGQNRTAEVQNFGAAGYICGGNSRNAGWPGRKTDAVAIRQFFFEMGILTVAIKVV